MCVLLVEDDPRMAATPWRGLRPQAVVAGVATDGGAALQTSGADDDLAKRFALAELRALAHQGPVERPAEPRVGFSLEAAWNRAYAQRSNVVEVYGCYLREIETLRAIGRRLRPDVGR